MSLREKRVESEKEQVQARPRSTCDNCVRAKVKCSGAPGPCERCSSWRNLECSFGKERKRGRPSTNDPHMQKRSEVSDQLEDAAFPATKSQITKLPKSNCSTCTDCWCHVSAIDEQTKADGDIIASLETGLSQEQSNVVQVFLELYMHHAQPEARCHEWFELQMNKLVEMLKTANSCESLLRVVEWMNKFGILVGVVQRLAIRSIQDVDEDNFPAPLSISGQLSTLEKRGTASQSSALCGSKTLSSRCACLKIFQTPNGRYSIKASVGFVELFGFDSEYFCSYLEKMPGPMLPWGCDVFANIFARRVDSILLIRSLAFLFFSRPESVISDLNTKQVLSTHVFPCRRSDGTSIDCVVRLDYQQQVLSNEEFTLDIKASFEPLNTPPRMTCQVSRLSSSGAIVAADTTKHLYEEDEDLWAEDLFHWMKESKV